MIRPRLIHRNETITALIKLGYRRNIEGEELPVIGSIATPTKDRRSAAEALLDAVANNRIPGLCLSETI
jgi:hypothetical protein